MGRSAGGKVILVSVLSRLGRALDAAPAERLASRHGAAAIRLLVLTGCRRNEILALRWDDVNFEAGELRLRDTKTGSRVVPLTPAAAEVLEDLPRVLGNPWVFPGKKWGTHQRNINDSWDRIRKRAGLDGALDYERWVEEGAAGWSYAEVLPYFRRSERHSRGEDPWRGGSGSLATVCYGMDDPLSRAFVEAGAAAGFPVTQDVNGYQQEGFGPFDRNIDRGERASTAHAFINPARSRPNLRIRTDTVVTKVLLEGRRARGVVCSSDGSAETVRAEREVILAAGAFHSPQLLMLSGVGPPDHLRDHGIAVAHELSGVGGNLQDHLEVHMQWRADRRHTRNRYAGPLARLVVGAQWFLTRRGVCASTQVEVGAFTRTSPQAAHPDIQYHFFPFLLEGWRPSRRASGFCVCVGTLRERSRGTVRLASGDPTAPPLIDFNYLDDPRDLDDLRTCVHQAREVVSQRAFDPFRGDAVAPWAAARDDVAIDAVIRESAESAYHPCGTCRMGDDPMSVVDPQCRVHGMEGLRVVDSSIMPSIVSGNLNAPTMMIGDKASDMILGRSALPPSNAGYFGAARSKCSIRIC